MFAEPISIVGKLANGFALTILGMGIVFVVLVIVSFVMDIMKIFLAGEGKAAIRREKGKKSTQTADIKDDMRNEALIPVISAAIAAYMETPSDELVVKSIGRISPKVSIWGAAGRQQQMSDRF